MKEIDIVKKVPAETLEMLGMTREQFAESNIRFLLEAMLDATDYTIDITTQKLMKEKGLSLGEAYPLAVKMTLKSAEEMMKGKE